MAHGGDHAVRLVDVATQAREIPVVRKVPHRAVPADVEDRVITDGVDLSGSSSRTQVGKSHELTLCRILPVEAVHGWSSALDAHQVDGEARIAEDAPWVRGLRHVEAGRADAAEV